MREVAISFNRTKLNKFKNIYREYINSKIILYNRKYQVIMS